MTDGERQAYHETAKEDIQKNKDRISELRKENDELRKESAEKLAVILIIFSICYTLIL